MDLGAVDGGVVAADVQDAAAVCVALRQESVVTDRSAQYG